MNDIQTCDSICNTVQPTCIAVVVINQGLFTFGLAFGTKTQTQDFSTENLRIFGLKTQEIGKFRDNFGRKVQISHENGGF